jgi:DNA-binding NarL/FixJ family response regulator
MNTIRVLIVDDHAIVREGLRSLLTEEPDIEVVGEAKDGEDAVAQVLRREPDVVLLDLRMPGALDGLAALARMREQRPRTQVVVLTTFSGEREVKEAVASGAIGYLLKDALKDDILRAVRNAAVGRPSLHPEAQRHLMRRVAAAEEPAAHEDLTARELDVLRLLGQGQSNRAIAACLDLSEGTVKGYVSTVLSKLGVEDRTQAALYAVRHGLVTQDGPA